MEAVGLGCIWFALRADENKEIDLGDFVPSAHVAEIRKALESLDSVTNLEINGSEESLTGIWGINEITEENNFFPMFSSLLISFDLIIPRRFHDKYTLGRAADVETFHIKVFYSGSMPVTYVHYSVDGGEESVNSYAPSTAVVIVRRFLEEKLRDHPTIDYQMLGPSPFHADVFIAGTDAVAFDSSKDLTIPEGGYRTLFFLFKDGSADDLIAAFVEKHNEALSSFYTLIRMKNFSRSLRETVTDGALELLSQSEPRGRWPAFKYWRNYQTRIDTVFEALLQEKLNRVANDRFESSLNEDVLVDQSSLFFRFIEREINEKPQMPDEDIREILLMLEERRRGYFENLSTLASGLVGGLLGAALGAFLTFGLAHHVNDQSSQVKVVPTSTVPANAQQKESE